jgi:hypothetical protein
LRRRGLGMAAPVEEGVAQIAGQQALVVAAIQPGDRQKMYPAPLSHEAGGSTPEVDQHPVLADKGVPAERPRPQLTVRPPRYGRKETLRA